MKRLPILRSILIAILATTAAMPVLPGSAAIPCMELPVIEPDPNMVITMIYIELPMTIEAAFDQQEPVDRTDSSAAGDATSSVESAAANQFRCLNYGNDVAFAGNSTPEQRVKMWNRPAVNAAEAPFLDADQVFVERLGAPIQLEDGRYVIDFGIIVDSSQYLTGEMVFREESDGFYLDGTAISDSIELNQPPVDVELSTRFTREVKIIDVANGEMMVVFDNIEEEASANIVITDPEGETIFEGFAPALHLVGGEPTHIFVIHDLAPGAYQVTITFDGDDAVTYNQTLMVSDGDDATPVASPES